MEVLVDTSVWSVGLRRQRKQQSPHEREMAFQLRELIIQDRVLLIGVVRQELLTGIGSVETFNAMSGYLEDFEDLPNTREDFVSAARFANACASRGVATSAPDMLICAVAARVGVPIWTIDNDFIRYAQVLPIELFSSDG